MRCWSLKAWKKYNVNSLIISLDGDSSKGYTHATGRRLLTYMVGVLTTLMLMRDRGVHPNSGMV